MAFVKLLKVDTDGVPVEMLQGSDEIIMGSFTVSGGPVLSASGLDMMNQDVVNIQDLNFSSPSTATINQTAGLLTIDNLMAKDRENVMALNSSVLFPTVGNVSGEIDAFRLPTVAGIPTAAPAAGGSGYGVWDYLNGVLSIWDGLTWQSFDPNSSEQVSNIYTAGEALTKADVVYISADDTVSKASGATTGVASRAMGVARMDISNGAMGYVQSEGVADGFTGLSFGARYFLSTTVAGGVQTTAPSAAGHTIVQVGYAKNATSMHLHIEQMGRRS